MWTITRLENLSGVYVECYRFSIFVVTDSVYYKYQYSKTYTPTSGFNNFSSSNYSLNRCLFKPFHLLLTNTKIINQYRLTYTLCSELNSVPLYESERTREEIFIRIKGDNMSTFWMRFLQIRSALWLIVWPRLRAFWLAARKLSKEQARISDL